MNPVEAEAPSVVPDAATRHTPGLTTMVVAVVAALVLGALAGVMLVRPQQTPSDSSAEAGFARDMSVHHAQAVDMAFSVYQTTHNAQIKNLAYDIINTQRAQIGMFSGWLQQWELPQTTVRPPMQWADHGHGESMTTYEDMPGMASDFQMAQLASLHGRPADRLFLTLMIEHHKGGVAMAESILPLTDRAEVQRLAQTIVDGQQAEIVNMQEMLAGLNK